MADLKALFDKLGKNAGLSIRDRLDLRTLGGNLAAIESAFRTWTDPGSTSPRFTHFYADEGTFGKPPLEAARFRRISTSQSIPNNTWTAVDFDEETFNEGGLFDWDSAGDVSLIEHRHSSTDMGFLVFGQIRFADNGTGWRGVNFERKPSGTVVMHTQAAFTGYANALPFALPYRANSTATGLEIEVFQNSTAALNLEECYLGLIRWL